jgi:hypothetical protein
VGRQSQDLGANDSGRDRAGQQLEINDAYGDRAVRPSALAVEPLAGILAVTLGPLAKSDRGRARHLVADEARAAEDAICYSRPSMTL